MQLLSDLREVFGDAEKLPTETLLARLRSLPESAWVDIRGKPLDDRGLALRLRKYDVRPKKIRIGNATPRGYEATDLADAWKRYLPLLSPLPGKAEQTEQRNTSPQTPHEGNSKATENTEKLDHVPLVPLVPLFHGDDGRDTGVPLDARHEDFPELPEFLDRRRNCPPDDGDPFAAFKDNRHKLMTGAGGA